MKKKLKLLALLPLFFGLLITSCSKDGNENESLFIGTWERAYHTHMLFFETLIFSEDKHYVHRIIGTSSTSGSFQEDIGTYSSSKTKVLTLTSKSGKSYNYSFFFGDSTLNLTDETGFSRTYRKRY